MRTSAVRRTTIRKREVRRLVRGRPRDWRDIETKEEWRTYRLRRVEANLAVGALLRELRRAAGVTQREVYERLGVSQSALSSWEAGIAAVPEYRVARFRRAIIAAANKRVRSYA